MQVCDEIGSTMSSDERLPDGESTECNVQLTRFPQAYSTYKPEQVEQAPP